VPRVIKTLLCLGCLLAAAAGGLVAYRSTRPSPAPSRPPLVAPPPEAICFPILHAGSFGYGLATVENSSDGSAVLDSVRLLRPSPGLVTVRAYVAMGGLKRYGMAEAWRTWPPPTRVRGQLYEIKGFRVPPHIRWSPNFIFHLRWGRRGVVRSPGILIRYHQGDHRYTLVDPLALQVSPVSPCSSA
jgi:hypothetical protein